MPYPMRVLTVLAALALQVGTACSVGPDDDGGSPDAGITGDGDDTTLLYPIDPAGFSVLTPSADSLTIYVSSSLGDDANDGLSEATPVKTVGRAVSMARTGYPDYILFRKGDTWWEARHLAEERPLG